MAAKIAAAVKARRRHLYIIARTDAAASEGMDGAVARAKLYLEAGADAIFPEALTTADMFREFARRVNAPLLANMTEFGRTPFFTAAEFESMGYRMVIWPASALRIAAKAQERALCRHQPRRRAAQSARADADAQGALRDDRLRGLRDARCLDRENGPSLALGTGRLLPRLPPREEVTSTG